jgi:hypothetical protein
LTDMNKDLTLSVSFGRHQKVYIETLVEHFQGNGKIISVLFEPVKGMDLLHYEIEFASLFDIYLFGFMQKEVWENDFLRGRYMEKLAEEQTNNKNP